MLLIWVIHEFSPAHTPADEELLEVLSRAVAKLNIEWPADAL